jgi:hypothetical protein
VQSPKHSTRVCKVTEESKERERRQYTYDLEGKLSTTSGEGTPQPDEDVHLSALAQMARMLRKEGSTESQAHKTDRNNQRGSRRGSLAEPKPRPQDTRDRLILPPECQSMQQMRGPDEKKSQVEELTDNPEAIMNDAPGEGAAANVSSEATERANSTATHKAPTEQISSESPQVDVGNEPPGPPPEYGAGEEDQNMQVMDDKPSSPGLTGEVPMASSSQLSREDISEARPAQDKTLG